jgi:3'(2'), 5'-bisphosphate nucleotidase
MSLSYSKERLAGIEAVRLAAVVCRAVQAKLITADSAAKKDRSPVTVADYASQAVVCAHLLESGCGQPVVGEEGSGELRAADQAELRGKVVERVAEGLGRTVSETQALHWIDRGGHVGDGTGVYWTLDPIDGTKGFLRKEQYAIALALIENGKVVLGILGCPNLPADSLDENRGEPGVLYVAERGKGTVRLSLWNRDHDGNATPVKVSGNASTAAARFCESVESGHSDQDASVQIAKALGITHPAVRLDSQAKYGVVGRGEASIYLRLPTRADYQEKIWDHAAGAIVVEEAGGKVTDIAGKPLDFSKGNTLSANSGVVATNGKVHAAVVAAVRSVLGA